MRNQQVKADQPMNAARVVAKDIPQLICNFKRPRIYWYQTDVEVVARIMLNDVENYFLRVTTDEVEFSTTLADVEYYTYMHLFGAVIAEETSHATKGREITVHLPKVHKWASWPRLLHSSEKSPLIFVDIDRIEALKPKTLLSNWEEKEDFTSYKRRNHITQILPDVPSSAEDESSDEDCNLMFNI